MGSSILSMRHSGESSPGHSQQDHWKQGPQLRGSVAFESHTNLGHPGENSLSEGVQRIPSDSLSETGSPAKKKRKNQKSTEKLVKERFAKEERCIPWNCLELTDNVISSFPGPSLLKSKDFLEHLQSDPNSTIKI
ncbi:hypothetical protein AJ79_10320 [Helicocarpus griseus UAMH5409]|uniref:Uncharacterized protein n=1 Tax=Helicocarpus griseus UAMH5409 TaxID=1447875 RepID=A0A2B7W680_9EURO|nr:hypothetical protein AJ79_10320 [Helicocarpus griseus UAMH5409]